MANTRDDYTGDGSTTDFTITFGFKGLEEIVYVYLNGTLQVNGVSDDYTIVSETTVRFATAPELNDAIVIRRASDFDNRPSGQQWTDTSKITAAAHNLEDDFSLFRDQELQNEKGLPLSLSGRYWEGFDPNDGTTRLQIKEVKDPTAAQDVVTLNYLQDYVSGGSTGVANAQRAQYTGDGETVTFNLVTAGEGQIPSVDTVVAYVGNRILEPTEYSIASNKIDVTFDDPPGEGEPIDMWIVTGAMSTVDDGTLLPAKLSLTQDYLITGDASNEGTEVTRASITLDEWGAAAGNVSMGSNKLTNLAAPTADNDAARKKYVDDNIGKKMVATVGETAYTIDGTANGAQIANSSGFTQFVGVTIIGVQDPGEAIKMLAEISNDSFGTAKTVGAAHHENGSTYPNSIAFLVPSGYSWRLREAQGRGMDVADFTITYQTGSQS